MPQKYFNTKFTQVENTVHLLLIKRCIPLYFAADLETAKCSQTHAVHYPLQ